ncbi:MAG TPA: GDSL-type esterase/lipase family protein [Roseiarcus sp.]|nr:GDSL-type esterase/lipase family protein [Roseiarcus sp.]
MARGLYCVLIAGILSLMVPFAAGAAETRQARIAFVGDSMADGLWGAMFRRIGKNKCLGEKVTLIRKAKNGTGLTRLDQFNWVEEMKTLAKGGNVDLFVGSFGVNDRQAIVEPDKTRVEFGTPQFDARYKAVLSEAVQGALSQGSSVVVAGLPVMMDQAANADAVAKNKLFAEAIKDIGSDHASYAPPWSTPGEDRYRPYLPNANNALIQVRAQDGVHFTPAGYDMVLNALLPAIREALKVRGQDPTPECEHEVSAK